MSEGLNVWGFLIKMTKKSVHLQEEEKEGFPRFCSTFRVDLMAERLPKLQKSKEGGEDVRRQRTGQKPERERKRRDFIRRRKRELEMQKGRETRLNSLIESY